MEINSFVCIILTVETDFMNEDKFVFFILKRTSGVIPPQWDMLNETGTIVIDHIKE